MNSKPKVIAFDIFGTVEDWHGSIAAEERRLKLTVDANAFATAWREDYQPAMTRVRSRELNCLGQKLMICIACFWIVF
jgi:2-haloacid dehalogenase